MRILSLFNEFLTKNRKTIIYILGFLFLFVCFSDITFANTDSTTPPKTQVTETKNSSEWVTILNELIKAVAVVITFWTNIVGWFLYPEWTNWTIIWINNILKTIWIMVSNLVYFIFAWVFIWIAFMNIIGKDWDTYQLKQALPRFIVWVLIVPFSWFFVQFVISASSILTAAVLSLPMSDEIYQSANLEKSDNIPICRWWYTIHTWTKESLSKVSWTKESSGEWYVIVCNEKDKNGKLTDLLQWNGIYSIMYYYTFAVMKFDDYWKIFSWDIWGWINSIIALLFKTWFSILFIIIYAILIIALWMALFIRWVRFWMFAMFSPVFWLFYFFKKDGWWDGAAKNFSVKNLISLAMVPVYVSWALVFGLVFLMVAWKWITENKLIQKDDKTWNTYLQVPWNENKATRVYWDWVYHNEKWNSAIDDFQSNFWTLVMQIFGIMFLWMWVMAALKSSEITWEVVDPIAKFGSSIGDLMKKMPTYAPIFPGGLSAQGLQQVWSAAGTSLSKFEQKRTDQWLKDRWLFQDPDVNASAKSKIVREEIEREQKFDDDNMKKFTNALKDFSNLRSLTNDAEGKKMIEAAHKRLFPDDKIDLTNANEKQIAEAIAKINNWIIDKQNTNGIFWDKTRITSGKELDEVSKLFNKKWSETETPAAPWNWTQTININTWNKTIPNTNIDINLKDWKITDLGEFNKWKWQYTETDFRTNVLDKITWIDKTEKDRIITELKKTKDFFNKS